MAQGWTFSMSQPIKIKGTVLSNTIMLEQPLSFPDGTQVLLSVELLPGSEEDSSQSILDLSGAWKSDSSLAATFEEIAQERRVHRGREG